jgi:hypothetical protein
MALDARLTCRAIPEPGRPGPRRLPWGGDEDQEYPGHQDSATGGAAGNERLTGLTGLTLLILFAVEGFTILAVRQMLTLHFFVGMLLASPVLLKLCRPGTGSPATTAAIPATGGRARRPCCCGCSGPSLSSPRWR